MGNLRDASLKFISRSSPVDVASSSSFGLKENCDCEGLAENASAYNSRFGVAC